jgi:hypothetical protein
MNNAYPAVYAPAPQQGEYQSFSPPAPEQYVTPQRPAAAPSHQAQPEKKKKKQENKCWDTMCCCYNFWLTD